MAEPLFIRPEDSGTASSPTIIRGEKGATICGDMPQQHTQIHPKEEGKMERIINFDKEARTITIPTPPRNVLNQKNLEMVVHQRWAIAILRVKEMKVTGANTIVTFMEPESRIEFEHPWPQPVIGGEKGNSSYLLRTTEQRDGIEQLVMVEGTAATPVRHVTFEGITFANTCWNRPLHKGHVTLQGGFPIIDAYKLQQEGLPWAATLENQAWIERPTAAVRVTNAQHVDFHSCTFENLASTALDYTTSISDCKISDNTFTHMSKGGSPPLQRPRGAMPATHHPRQQHHRGIVRGLGSHCHLMRVCQGGDNKQQQREGRELLRHLCGMGMDPSLHWHGGQPHHRKYCCELCPTALRHRRHIHALKPAKLIHRRQRNRKTFPSTLRHQRQGIHHLPRCGDRWFHAERQPM